MPPRTMSEAARPTKRKKTFQERLEELQTIVEELESGDLSLEEAIARFEAGQKLHALLQKELQSYEKRIEKLVGDGEGRDRLETVSGTRSGEAEGREDPEDHG